MFNKQIELGYKITQDDLRIIMMVFTTDYAEIPTFITYKTVVESGQIMKLSLQQPRNEYYLKKLNNKIMNLLQFYKIFIPNASDYDKEVLILRKMRSGCHQFLSEFCNVGTEDSLKGLVYHNFSKLGLARLFKFACLLNNLNCHVICGQGQVLNLVELEGAFYFVDCYQCLCNSMYFCNLSVGQL